jgi:hypothetical protein
VFLGCGGEATAAAVFQTPKPHSDSLEPKISAASVDAMLHESDTKVRPHDTNQHIFRGPDQREASEAVAQAAFLESARQLMEDHKVADAEQKEREKTKVLVDPAIAKIQVLATIHKLENCRTESVFTKQSAAKYAEVEITKTFNDLQDPDTKTSLQNSYKALKDAFEKSVSPCGTAVTRLVAEWKAFIETHVDDGEQIMELNNTTLKSALADFVALACCKELKASVLAIQSFRSQLDATLKKANKVAAQNSASKSKKSDASFTAPISTFMLNHFASSQEEPWNETMHNVKYSFKADLLDTTPPHVVCTPREQMIEYNNSPQSILPRTGHSMNHVIYV